MMIQAIRFDLDETLLDRSAGLEAFLHDQYHWYGAFLGHVPFSTFRRRFIALDTRGSVHTSVVYTELLAEFAIPMVTMPELLPDYRSRCWQHGTTLPRPSRAALMRRQKPPTALCKDWQHPRSGV
jgi:putative hydrolase of the HAD superfamily